MKNTENSNPFSLSFGRKPQQYISRLSQTAEIVETFNSPVPATQVYMISGVRGSGKTVMLNEVSSQIGKDWVIIDLNPTTDMLKSLTSKLYSSADVNRLFVDAKVNLSFFGIGVSFEKVPPVTDYETAITRMLEVLNRAHKRVLITVDEVTGSDYVKQFASAFQIFVRHDLPVFLLMTGLYDNIYDLQNDNSLTFLYRSPKIYLDPLNIIAIRNSYRSIFDLDKKTASRLADLTMGYPFAYQVLGYLYWNSDRNIDRLLPDYDQYLQEFAYEKMWSELSAVDRKVIEAISVTSSARVKDIREVLRMDSDKFSVYRSRLLRKGIVRSSEYGKLELTLPRFDIYVRGITGND